MSCLCCYFCYFYNAEEINLHGKGKNQFIPCLGSSSPWYDPQFDHDDIFRITDLPKSSLLRVKIVSKVLDVA